MKLPKMNSEPTWTKSSSFTKPSRDRVEHVAAERHLQHDGRERELQRNAAEDELPAPPRACCSRRRTRCRSARRGRTGQRRCGRALRALPSPAGERRSRERRAACARGARSRRHRVATAADPSGPDGARSAKQRLPDPLESPAGEAIQMKTTNPGEARPSVSRVPYAIGDAVRKPAQAMRSAVNETADLLGRSGALRFGQGTIATVVALTLGVLCLLAVLAFHFPEYLTTPELRHQYSVDVLRQVLFVGLARRGRAVAREPRVRHPAQRQSRFVRAGDRRGRARRLARAGRQFPRLRRRTSGSTGSSSICSARR